MTTAISRGETEKALSMIRPDLPLDAVANGQHRSPVFAAIETDNATILEALLAAGASLSATNDKRETPLHAAAARDNEAVVRVLLARGADVDAAIARPKHQLHGRTPLMNVGNNLSMAKLLLEHGADPFLKDGAGMTALSFAEIFGKRTATYLRKVMASSPGKGNLGLCDAARAGLADRVQVLLDGGAAVGEKGEVAGRTALHWAVVGGYVDLVRLLLEHGAPVDARDVHGNSPLVFARDNPEIVRLLLASGADPNAEAGYGFTTFLCLAGTAKPEVLGLLLDAGANLKAKSADGRGVLEHAKLNRPAARQFLKERMGLAADAIDLLRAELKDLPRLAKEPAFEAAAARIGNLVNRKPAPWRKRKGVLYLHNVSIVKYLAPYYGESVNQEREAGRIFDLLAKLQDEVTGEGFSLAYVGSIPDDEGRVPLILLPTANKYVAVLACGTNGINQGHDTEKVISWLMDMEKEAPFVLAGCGHDFLDGRFAAPVKDAPRLAERMIAFCPDMVDQAAAPLSSLARPEQTVALARQLTESGWFGFWWD